MKSKSIARPGVPEVKLLICLAAAYALWLNANPYIGIDHDARLYSVAAYRWLSPLSWEKDPWFLFGSQDDYSLFSPLLAGMFVLLGVGEGARWATLLHGFLFAIAVTTFARQGMGGRRYIVAALLMTAFPLLYSPSGMLYVTEGFVTARGIAIPLSLLGLVASFRRRAGWALGIHAVALALHPIMALTPATISFLYSLPRRLWWRSIFVAWVAFVTLLAAAAAGRLPLIDGAWHEYVRHAPLVFATDWIVADISRLMLWGGVVLTAARWGSPRLRRLYVLVLLVAGNAVAFSLLATIVPWTQALQAQFWRGLWVVKLVAMCAVADLLLRLLTFNSRHLKAQRFIASATFYASFGHPLVALGMFLLLHWNLSRTSLNNWLETHAYAYRMLMLSVVVLSIPEIMFALTDRVGDVSVAGYWPELLRGFWRTACLGLLAVALGAILERANIVVGALIVSGLLVAAAVKWDIRTTERRSQEARYSIDGREGPFGSIPQGAVVYWPEETERVWFELAKPSYVGNMHAIGMVFSRGRASLVEQRMQKIVVASLQSGFPPIMDTDAVAKMARDVLKARPFVDPLVVGKYEMVGRPTRPGIAWLCQDRQLDFVVDSPVASTAGTVKPVLVACADFRPG